MRETLFLSENMHFNSYFVDGVLNSSIVSRTDKKGIITFVNHNFEIISGYSEKELIGAPHRIVNSGYHSHGFWIDMWQTISKGNIWRGEVCNRSKDGSLYWVDTFIYPYCNEDGEIEEYFSIRNDITMRKQQRETLVRLEADLRSTIDNSNFLIWSINKEYILTSFNNKFAEFAKKQYDIEVKLGICLPQSVPLYKNLHDRWLPRFDRVLKGEKFKLKSEIEGDFYELSFNPIIEGDKVIGATVFCENITERLRLEEEVIAINKHLTETRLMALRATMNPHFVFNALNSIQYYILKSDRKNAIFYFSKFSKFIRATLDSLRQSSVSLAKTIEMIEHYIELEMLRFDHKFDLNITIDPQINIESVEIPPLLIQPFIENAVEHGLSKKNENGLLKILFSKVQEKMMLIEVEDNGIGRKAAAEYQLNLPEHKSAGIFIAKERLKLLNGEDTTSLEIIDLEKNGSGKGTLVRIWVKI